MIIYCIITTLLLIILAINNILCKTELENYKKYCDDAWDDYLKLLDKYLELEDKYLELKNKQNARK